jgi:hypothetical protein
VYKLSAAHNNFRVWPLTVITKHPRIFTISNACEVSMRIFFFIISIVMCSSAMALNEGDKALGLMLGNPSGLTGKYWLEDNVAIDAGLGISLGGRSKVSAHSDYLLHRESAFYFNDTHPLDLYYGGGLRMKFGDDDIDLGIRAPVGVVHNLADQKADVFLEVAPILDLFARFGLEIHLLAGGRYYF